MRTFDAFLDSGHNGDFGGAADDPDHEGFDDLDTEDDGLSGDHVDGGATWADRFVSDQKNIHIAPDDDEAPGHTKKQNPAGPRRTRITKRVQAKGIDEDDFFDEEEKISFISIRDEVLLLLNGTTAKARGAVAWLFGDRTNSYGLTYSVCAQALGVREHILHTRLHYEMWLRWMVFTFEFPFMVTPIPNRVKNEIRNIAGNDGVLIAQEAWIRPGITTADLLMQAAGVKDAHEVPDEYLLHLKTLEAAHILSSQRDNWYLTSRNPNRAAVERQKAGYRRRDDRSWPMLF